MMMLFNLRFSLSPILRSMTVNLPAIRDLLIGLGQRGPIRSYTHKPFQMEE